MTTRAIVEPMAPTKNGDAAVLLGEAWSMVLIAVVLSMDSVLMG